MSNPNPHLHLLTVHEDNKGGHHVSVAGYHLCGPKLEPSEVRNLEKPVFSWYVDARILAWIVEELGIEVKKK